MHTLQTCSSGQASVLYRTKAVAGPRTLRSRMVRICLRMLALLQIKSTGSGTFRSCSYTTKCAASWGLPWSAWKQWQGCLRLGHDANADNAQLIRLHQTLHCMTFLSILRMAATPITCHELTWSLHSGQQQQNVPCLMSPRLRLSSERQ